MARRNQGAADEAAAAASEAARTLQARGQEAKMEQEPVAEAKPVEREIIRKNSPRDDAMKEILGRSEPPAEETPAEVAPEVKPEVKAEEPPKDIPAEVQPLAVEAPKTIRVKVDGEEFDALEEEVNAAGGVTSYQRDKASENRLKKANEALAEVRRIQAQMAETQRVNQPPPIPQKPIALQLQEKMDIIRFGSPEESAQALQDVITLANPRQDPNQIVQAAVSEGQRLAAIEKFVADFPDLNSNPMLSKLVAVEAQERMQKARQQGGYVDWNTFYRQIGNEVRSVIPRQSQSQSPEDKTAATNAATATDSTSPVSHKEARKATIVNLPTAAQRATLPEEQKPESREETLDSMRKKRGLLTG